MLDLARVFLLSYQFECVGKLRAVPSNPMDYEYANFGG